MRAEFINPFVSATTEVFKLMLDCDLTRGRLELKQNLAPTHEVNGMIGLSGRCRGMVMVGIDRSTAIGAAERMLGSRPDDLDSDVLDAIGELTNMIAGAAKTKLEEYQLSIGLPTVVCGTLQTIKFPPGAAPIIIPFQGALGTVCVEVGLVESSPA